MDSRKSLRRESFGGNEVRKFAGAGTKKKEREKKMKASEKGQKK